MQNIILRCCRAGLSLGLLLTVLACVSGAARAGMTDGVRKVVLPNGLTILVLEVRTIDRRVGKVKETLRAARDNTNDTALIGVTAEGVEAVLAEGLEHHLFLGRVLDKVRM